MKYSNRRWRVVYLEHTRLDVIAHSAKFTPFWKRGRRSFVLSEVCRGTPQLPRNSHIRQSISARAGLAILSRGVPFPVAIFSLYARISVSVTNSHDGSSGSTTSTIGTHLPHGPSRNNRPL